MSTVEERVKKIVCEQLEVMKNVKRRKRGDVNGGGDGKSEKRSSAYYGIRRFRGLLLAGPSGTGKTLVAKALANETRSEFLATCGSEFIEVFVGKGA